MHHALPRRRLCLAALAAAVSVPLALPSAHALDKPTGRVVLTISGNLSQTNDGKQASFDMKMLEALPQTTFVTRSPWYETANSYTGPLLRDLLAAVGAKGDTIVAVALNDYRVEIPYQDAIQHDLLIARLMNGKPMPVRDKGPLFVIYPFDTRPELQTERYYNRSIWQLRSLQVR